ncbi:class I SAM-dependent methyltransferase [Halomonas sp. V046]|uniref:class I SAM-dependent methyltransferase n=1 Tax=Halomonas sp. V046 TaxID=3459611 RepID=UPI0040440E66
MPTCPLCAAEDSAHFYHDGRRDYYRCRRCDLIAVPPHQRLAPDAEKAVYDQHDNRPGDPGYRAFLGRLFMPLCARLAPGSQGLDIGAGPGPTLSLMFAEAGFPTAIHDPFFHPNPAALRRQYDFVTATEVAEHLFTPGETLAQWLGCLKPGGWLGLMTKRTPPDFPRWHYIRDPTHVVFFSDASFSWIAEMHGLSLDFPGPDVVILGRPTKRR